MCKKGVTERPLPILKLKKILRILSVGTIEDRKNYVTHFFKTKVLNMEQLGGYCGWGNWVRLGGWGGCIDFKQKC